MKQALVVGLGMFGLSLARELTNRGFEVIGVDKNPDAVEEAESIIAEAVSLDASDMKELAEVAPERRDVCICGIGEDARDASIICTALMVESGCKRVIARASDKTHERILKAVGAHEIVNPEKDFGSRLAMRLAFHGVIDQVPLGSDLVITHLEVPQALVGQSLQRLQLPSRFEVFVVAIEDSEEGAAGLRLPDPQATLDARDVLVVVSRRGGVEAMLGQIG